LLEKGWKDGAYGKKIVKEAEELFSNRPISITACYLSSSKYMFKFSKNKRRFK
jgi:hypothetical protein